MAGNADILLVVLAPTQPALSLRDDAPEELTAGGARYSDAGQGEFTGFYDWLRTSTGVVVGVRYWPFEETQALLGSTSSLPYVERVPGQDSLAIYFSSERDVDPRASGDQAFGGNRLLTGDDGAIALTFDTSGLDERELETLRGTLA